MTGASPLGPAVGPSAASGFQTLGDLQKTGDDRRVAGHHGVFVPCLIPPVITLDGCLPMSFANLQTFPNAAPKVPGITDLRDFARHGPASDLT